MSVAELPIHDALELRNNRRTLILKATREAGLTVFFRIDNHFSLPTINRSATSASSGELQLKLGFLRKSSSAPTSDMDLNELEQLEPAAPQMSEVTLFQKLKDQDRLLAEQSNRIEALENENQMLWKGYQGAGGLGALLLLGASLTKAARAFFGGIGKGKSFPRKEAADLFAAVIRRVVFVGFLGLLVAGIPIWLMWEQNRLVESQNAAIVEQNTKIQTQLAQQAQATKVQQESLRRQEEDTLTVRRTQLLTLIYEEETCNLSAARNEWKKQKDNSKRIGKPFYDLAPRCSPKASIRLREEAVKTLAKLDGINLDLSHADLAGANLHGLNLTEANLINTNLSRAVLSNTDLSRATLSGANLSDAFLSSADLSGASLIGTNLDDSDLSEANLSDADLRSASLIRANAQGTELSSAIIQGANFADTRLTFARLFNVDLANPLSSEKSTIAKLVNPLPRLSVSQAQLDSTLGNSATTIPDSLKRPIHWQKEGESQDDWQNRLRDWLSDPERDIISPDFDFQLLLMLKNEYLQRSD